MATPETEMTEFEHLRKENERLRWRNQDLIEERSRFLPEVHFLREENDKFRGRLEGIASYEQMCLREYANYDPQDRERILKGDIILLRALLNDVKSTRELLCIPDDAQTFNHLMAISGGLLLNYSEVPAATAIKRLKEAVPDYVKIVCPEMEKYR